ncbi:MAG TPA: hypothetical protein DC084_26155, partial [Cupriavidus sp.]|nr:hypothetical protein [Cupriavidus sp.]
MIRRISELFGSRLRMLSAAVAGAIALAGCATAPTDETAAVAGQPGSPAASTATPVAPGPASATA